MNDGFVWNEERQIGFYPVKTFDQYNESYFRNYLSRSRTSVGRAITKARIDLVSKHVGDDMVVDIGIGSGHFIATRGLKRTAGYDVNEMAIRWLLRRGLWHDPYFQPVPNATCWDSLEHMEHPEHFILRVRGTLFVSIPVFRDRDHILSSKHFKTDEHFWYVTRNGFVTWMRELGLILLEENQMETDLGREDIGTFVFRRGPLPG